MESLKRVSELMGHEFEGLLGRCRHTQQHFSNCETEMYELGWCECLTVSHPPSERNRRISKLAGLIYEVDS